MLIFWIRCRKAFCARTWKIFSSRVWGHWAPTQGQQAFLAGIHQRGRYQLRAGLQLGQQNDRATAELPWETAREGVYAVGDEGHWCRGSLQGAIVAVLHFAFLTLWIWLVWHTDRSTRLL